MIYEREENNYLFALMKNKSLALRLRTVDGKTLLLYVNRLVIRL